MKKKEITFTPVCVMSVDEEGNMTIELDWSGSLRPDECEGVDRDDCEAAATWMDAMIAARPEYQLVPYLGNSGLGRHLRARLDDLLAKAALVHHDTVEADLYDRQIGYLQRALAIVENGNVWPDHDAEQKGNHENAVVMFLEQLGDAAGEYGPGDSVGAAMFGALVKAARLYADEIGDSAEGVLQSLAENLDLEPSTPTGRGRKEHTVDVHLPLSLLTGWPSQYETFADLLQERIEAGGTDKVFVLYFGMGETVNFETASIKVTYIVK